MKKNFASLLFIAGILLLSGCWDARDVGKLNIALLATFDMAREEDKVNPDDRVLVTVLFPELTGGNPKKFLTIGSTGKTVGETRVDRANRSFRSISVNETRSLLFSEDFARRGLKESLDIVYRNPFLSYHVEMAVVEGYAADILKVNNKSAPATGENINNLLEIIPDQNFVPMVSLFDFRDDELDYGRNPVLPILSRDGDNVEISGLAIFKKDKMVGKVDKNGMRFLTMLRGYNARGVITFPQPGGVGDEKYITLQGTNTRKVNVDIIDGRAYINIDIFIITDAIEVENGFILHGNMEKLAASQKAAEEYIVANCLEIVSKLQNQYRVDALNTGAFARAKYGKKILHLDWDSLFAEAEINVNAHVKIRNYGAIK